MDIAERLQAIDARLDELERLRELDRELGETLDLQVRRLEGRVFNLPADTELLPPTLP
jgi:hypothetical protein